MGRYACKAFIYLDFHRAKIGHVTVELIHLGNGNSILYSKSMRRHVFQPPFVESKHVLVKLLHSA